VPTDSVYNCKLARDKRKTHTTKLGSLSATISSCTILWDSECVHKDLDSFGVDEFVGIVVLPA
jgi:hypothetical protein